MKCQSCGQEVLLAERCPYCGRTTGVEGGAGTAAGRPQQDGQASGRFVGRIGRSPSQEARDGWSARAAWGAGSDPGRWPGAARARAGGSVSGWGYLRRLIAYLRDPAVAGWKKTLIMAAALYVLLPVDLVPSLLVPGVGWLDDLVLLWIGIPALIRELSAYEPRRKPGR